MADPNGYEVLSQAFVAEGVDTLFALLGDANMYWGTIMAEKYKVPLVPFLLGGVLVNRELMTADGVHPNREGAKVLADTIWPYLKPLAEAASTRRGTK